jgi:hypothetical protein
VSFQATNCWKSPAASTMALILDRWNTTVSSPVPFWWNVFQIEVFLYLLSCSSRAVLSFAYLVNLEVIEELLISHISKTIDSLHICALFIWIMLNQFIYGINKVILPLCFRSRFVWWFCTISFFIFLPCLFKKLGSEWDFTRKI